MPTLANQLIGMYAFANVVGNPLSIRYQRGFQRVQKAGNGRFQYTFETGYSLDIETQATCNVLIQSPFAIAVGPWSVEKVTNDIIEVHTHAFTGADQDFDHWLLVERVI
jgi:hypothetical protein